jgi:hypothetical protein
VVGILFRPAAGPLLTTTDPVALVSSNQPLPAAPTGPVQRIMTGVTYDQGELAQILRAWLLPLAAGVDRRKSPANAPGSRPRTERSQRRLASARTARI